MTANPEERFFMQRRSLAWLIVATLALGAVAAAESVDEIVAKNIEARGGYDAWKAVETMRMSGKILMGGTMEAPFTIEFKRPEKVRLEFSIQGQPGIQAYDGETAWMHMSFMGQVDPEAMDAERTTLFAQQADFEGELIDYKEKGHSVELVGKEEVEGTEAYKLKVVRDTGDVDMIYIDAEYFLEFKTESERSIQGQDIKTSIVYGDYKEVGDLILPHSMEQTGGGAPMSQMITMEKIELNPDIPDERFAMPEKVEAPEEPAEE
jgi:outer membrane lipoprotein-sorting protein